MNSNLVYKKLISRIKNKKFWAGSAPALIQTVYPFMVGFINTNRYFKFGFKLAISNIKNFYIDQFLDEKENIQITEKLVEIYRKNKFRKNYGIWKKILNNFYRKIEKLNRVSFSNFSDKELLNEYLDLMSLFIKAWTIPLILEGTAIFTENNFFPEFKKEISKLNLDNKIITQYFAGLSSPEKISFLGKERRDFLKLCILAKSNKNFKKDLKEHCQKFYWVHFGYVETDPITEEETLKLIKREIAKKPASGLKEELKKFLTFEKDIIAKKKKIIKILKISKKTQEIFKAISFFGHWIDERKEMNIRGNGVLIKYLKEIGGRVKIDYLLIGLTLPGEIKKIINNIGNPLLIKKWEKNLKQRKKGCVLVCEYKKKPILYDGKAFQEIFKNLFKKDKISKAKVLEGMVVSRQEKDCVIGKVRVILDPAKKKILPGEILVTSMTRPDFAPLTKEAKAVITDEGGMTCHAAIVSREMGIPCIVGTKIATKILKDGDLVELKLNHGKILILSSR